MEGDAKEQSSPVTRFVVLGTQRTGTTLIATCLNSHPQIKCYGEAFKGFEPRGTVDVADSEYLRYRRASLARRLNHWLRRERSVRAFLDGLYAEPHRAAVGFKFMLNQSRQTPAVLSYLRDQQVRAIDVFRENVLKTLVSRLSARATGVFHATQRNARPRIEVPLTGLVASLERLEAEKSRWREVVGSSLPMLRFSYEEFLRDRDRCSRQMLQFIGVSQLDLASPLTKMNPDNLADIVGNYAELARVLASTAFAHCLDGAA